MIDDEYSKNFLSISPNPPTQQDLVNLGTDEKELIQTALVQNTTLKTLRIVSTLYSTFCHNKTSKFTLSYSNRNA